MFNHADRFPLGPRQDNGRPMPSPPPAWPWGLSRMKAFLPSDDSDDSGGIPAGIDPLTQVTRYVGPDGRTIAADPKHRKTNTGTESKTRTQNPGDGQGPKSDQDHAQDHDND